MTDHYSTLGVGKDADEAAIKKAYRKKAMDAHPDRGGDADTMAAANRAYEVLADPERRKAYDETGSDAQPKSVQASAKDMLMACFAASLDSTPGMFMDETLTKLAEGKSRLIASRSDVRSRINSLRRRRDATKVKGPGENLVHMVIDQQIRDLEASLPDHDHKLKVVAKAIEMAKAYECSESPSVTNWGLAGIAAANGGVRFKF